MNLLKREFEAVDGRGSYWAKQQKLFAKHREEKIRLDKQEDQADADLAAFAAGVVLATAAQIEQFSLKLDTYETATVEALLANERAMEIVQAKLDDLLDRAYVVEDGRRVFKTEDGQQVFDEFGAEVSAEIIAPSAIDDSHPTWESYSSTLDEQIELKMQRAEILEFQDKLDSARSEIADSEISKEDLDALDAELAELMPPTVGDFAGLVPSKVGIEVDHSQLKTAHSHSNIVEAPAFLK